MQIQQLLSYKYNQLKTMPIRIKFKTRIPVP